MVRGADLLDSTPRQRFLQQLLGLPSPRYLHLPVAINAGNEKLGKQARATAVSTDAGNRALYQALEFLNQPLPDNVPGAGQDELWQWAIEHWDINALPRRRTLPAPEIYYD